MRTTTTGQRRGGDKTKTDQSSGRLLWICERCNNCVVVWEADWLADGDAKQSNVLSKSRGEWLKIRQPDSGQQLLRAASGVVVEMEEAEGVV